MLAFLLGLLAGWGTPMAEPRLAPFLESLTAGGEALEARETRLLVFGLCLFGAAVLAAILDEAHGIGLTAGAVIGLAIPRIRALIRAARAPDYDS